MARKQRHFVAILMLLLLVFFPLQMKKKSLLVFVTLFFSLEGGPSSHSLSPILSFLSTNKEGKYGSRKGNVLVVKATDKSCGVSGISCESFCNICFITSQSSQSWNQIIWLIAVDKISDSDASQYRKSREP